MKKSRLRKVKALPSFVRHPFQLGKNVAIGTALFTLAGVGLLQLVQWSWSWLDLVLLPLVSGSAAYVLTSRHAKYRLQYIRKTLKRIKNHSFESLDLAARDEGDEIQDVIRQVNRTGKVMAKEFDDVKKLENYRRDFIGNVSHELKTPIFAIRGFAETLLDGGLEDEEFRRTFVEKIVRNADRLSVLTQDLTEISRLETGRRAMDIKPFHVSRWVHDVVESVEALAIKSEIRVTVDIASGVKGALGDAIQLRQVLSNLLVNAINYSNPKKTVAVNVTLYKQEAVRISVVDEGIGVEKEHLSRLTERFFRVDKSRSRSGGGTGLGLSIVKHILAGHNQVLRIKSTPRKGSVFEFELPIAD